MGIRAAPGNERLGVLVPYREETLASFARQCVGYVLSSHQRIYILTWLPLDRFILALAGTIKATRSETRTLPSLKTAMLLRRKWRDICWQGRGWTTAGTCRTCG